MKTTAPCIPGQTCSSSSSLSFRSPSAEKHLAPTCPSASTPPRLFPSRQVARRQQPLTAKHPTVHAYGRQTRPAPAGRSDATPCRKHFNLQSQAPCRCKRTSRQHQVAVWTNTHSLGSWIISYTTSSFFYGNLQYYVAN